MPSSSARVALRPSRALAALSLLLPLLACGEPPEVMVRTAAAQTPSTSAFQNAASRALPAVVSIQVEARPPMMSGPFGRTPTPQPGTPQQRPLVPLGAGSGVFFREGGYILTNNHVVQQAERVTVTTYDRRTLEAEVVASDPSTDIAVVRVQGDRLPVAQLGDSDSLRLGQWVLALGSPLGLQFSVTAGIVSATGRSIGILAASSREEDDGTNRAAPLEDFIQTDAAINPGNSGGPLVDLDGRVIGINTAIASGTGTFVGYGFAVPIALARVVADQLIRFGEVRRPYLGVALDEVEPVDVRVYSLPAPTGAEVVRVEQGSPAARAGVRLGDVIVRLGTTPVETVSELQAALARSEQGRALPMRLVRYGQEVTLEVTPAIVRSGSRPGGGTTGEGPARAGLQVAQQGNHVVVASVLPYSTASRAGVRAGQVIVSANGREITSPAQLAEVVRTARDGVLSLVVEDPQVGRVIINYEMRS
jgi:serine protease Do